MEPEIIYQDENYLVINKPAGLLVHGASHIKEPTMVDWLIKKFPEIERVGEDLERPGIVHRLDKDVSGLMVIARNNNAFESLKEQFQKRTIVKEYTALAYGKVLKPDGEIDFPIKRSEQGFKMAAVPKNFGEHHDDKIRRAITEFEVIKPFINYTLLKLKIKTGRTHQIRVHLFAYGNPLVGDNLYSTAKTRIKNKKINLGRVFLVSTKLEFKNLDNKTLDFSVGLPHDLTEFLKTVR